jgi:hypothetical protein
MAWLAGPPAEVLELPAPLIRVKTRAGSQIVSEVPLLAFQQFRLYIPNTRSCRTVTMEFIARHPRRLCRLERR